MWYEDKIELCMAGEGGHDENFNPIRNNGSWVPLGNCKIHGNASAKTVRATDGNDKVYSYQITMYIPVLMPSLDDKVRITKSDGSITQKVMSVIGIGTTKNKLSIFL